MTQIEQGRLRAGIGRLFRREHCPYRLIWGDADEVLALSTLTDLTEGGGLGHPVYLYVRRDGQHLWAATGTTTEWAAAFREIDGRVELRLARTIAGLTDAPPLTYRRDRPRAEGLWHQESYRPAP